MEKDIILLDGNNNEIKADIICTFVGEENKKYIVYTFNKRSNRLSLIIHAATYEEVDGKLKLTPVPEEELHIIEEALNGLKREFKLIEEVGFQ